jgi:hypothetical protein
MDRMVCRYRTEVLQKKEEMTLPALEVYSLGKQKKQILSYISSPVECNRLRLLERERDQLPIGDLALKRLL